MERFQARPATGRAYKGEPQLPGSGTAELPNVTVQVLPFTAGAHAGINGSFHVLEFPDPEDPRVVYVDNLTSSLYLERSRDVGQFRLAFEQLQASALRPGESASMIANMAKEP